MNSEYDLIIIGAGFSGLACAEAAAKRNLNTLVLEKKSGPTKAIQTTGILVKEIADQLQVPDRLIHRIEGVRLYSPSLDYIDLNAPEYYFLATDTPGLMQWFTALVKNAGVNIRNDYKYSGSYFFDGYHYIDNNNLRCRYLAGCDGTRSQVASNYNLTRNRKYLVGIEAEYPSLNNMDQDMLHVFLDSELCPGYIGWVVPGVNCTQVGLACRFPTPPRLNKFLQKIKPVINLDTYQPVTHRAGLIPCGGILKNSSNKNVMLLGDAAGMVSPLTAGGIHPAIQYGSLAGEFIADYLLDDEISPITRLENILPSYSFKKFMRLCNDYYNPPNRLYNLLFKSRFFNSLAQTIFFHHRGLLSKAAWRDLGRIILHP